MGGKKEAYFLYKMDAECVSLYPLEDFVWNGGFGIVKKVVALFRFSVYSAAVEGGEILTRILAKEKEGYRVT